MKKADIDVYTCIYMYTNIYICTYMIQSASKELPQPPRGTLTTF